MVIVRAGIAVVGEGAIVINGQRSRPDGRCAGLNNMIQFVDNTLYITTLTTVDIRFVGRFEHAGHYVVGRITITETVRSDEINHIARGKGFTPLVVATLGDDVVE